MKIKIENVLDKVLSKFGLKRIEKKEKGKVIKFENSNVEESKEAKTRRGAVNLIKGTPDAKTATSSLFA